MESLKDQVLGVKYLRDWWYAFLTIESVFSIYKDE